MDDFGWPRALVASTTSFGMLIFGIMAVLTGHLSDRYGPRLIMTVCGIFLGCGFMFMSRATSIWHMYLSLSLLAGIGVSGTDVVLLSTTTRWFVRKRGLMIGIVKVGTGVGMLIMPLLINRLIAEFGWRMACLSLGLLSLTAFVLLSQFLVRDPAKMGLDANGLDGAIYPNGESIEQGLTLGQTYRTVQFWTICSIYFLLFICMSTILMHVVPHAIDLGISPSSAAGVLSTLGALSIAGRFFMGGAADRIGSRMALIISFGFLITGLVWLQFSTKLWMLYLFAAVHGFAHGGFFALIAPVVTEYFGTRVSGVILGIVIFISTTGGALGPVLAGTVFDATGSYRLVFLVLTGLCLAGIAAAYTLKPVRQ